MSLKKGTFGWIW